MKKQHDHSIGLSTATYMVVIASKNGQVLRLKVKE